MSDWAAKRFWTKASVETAEGGYTVALDGRPVRTPAKAPLILPSRAMALKVAAEWDAQEDKIEPLTMPYTRSANAATDKVTAQHAEVADMLASYGDSDLICYRAADPQGLVERQNKGWDPLVDWSATQLKAPLKVFVGVMHASQSKDSLKTLSQRVHALSPFQLTAFHDLVSLSGSLVIGFAVVDDYATAEDLWDISRIDEQWQIDQWGRDEEAETQAEIKRAAFLHADAFFRVSA
ncbi:MAG: ATP12 family protein [Pseudomonadota bacterium]